MAQRRDPYRVWITNIVITLFRLPVPGYESFIVHIRLSASSFHVPYCRTSSWWERRGCLASDVTLPQWLQLNAVTFDDEFIQETMEC